MKTVLAPLFAALICLSLLSGCSSKKAIVGKWRGDGGQIEFTNDGKLLMNMGGISINANYTLPDDTHFTMNLDLGGKQESKTIAYKVDGDTMTTEEGGKKETMKRVR